MIRKNLVVLLLAVTIAFSSVAFAAPKNDSSQDGATTQGFWINK